MINNFSSIIAVYAGYRRDSIVELLSSGADVNIRDQMGKTPLDLGQLKSKY